MKILFVKSDSEYGALIFKENFEPNEVAKDMEVGDRKVLQSKPSGYDGEFEEQEIYCQLLGFSDVDPKFIIWLYDNMIDYDDAKHTNFYVVGEV